MTMASNDAVVSSVSFPLLYNRTAIVLRQTDPVDDL
jgi:hypothetical protein